MGDACVAPTHQFAKWNDRSPPAEHLRLFPVWLLLLGPRQAGKSSLLHKCTSGHAYVNLDDLATRDLYLSSYMQTYIERDIRERFRHRAREAQVHFWRTRDGQEIDFLVENDGKTFPIEVKLGSPMDAEYIATHVGGGNHRMFDGGHTIIGAIKAVRDASPDDSIIEGAIGASDAGLMSAVASTVPVGGEDPERVRDSVIATTSAELVRTGAELVAFLRGSPLVGEEFKMDRDKSRGRVVDIGT